MIWKLFSSERKVQEALEKSTGYDISPNQVPAEIANAPAQSANANIAAEAAPASLRKVDNRTPAAEGPKLELWTDYEGTAANSQEKQDEDFFGLSFQEPWEKKKA